MGTAPLLMNCEEVGQLATGLSNSGGLGIGIADLQSRGERVVGGHFARKNRFGMIA